MASDSTVWRLLDCLGEAELARIGWARAACEDTGLNRFPSRQFGINTAWLTVVMIAVDLLTWAQTLLLADHPTLARAEPKTLRYRLLHVAARLVHGGRRHRLRIDRHWPWATALTDAFQRCAALPQPAR